MTTNAWFQLATRLKTAEERYLEAAKQSFERNNFQDAARFKSIADGISYARSIQDAISAEAREKAVGSATQPS